MSIQPITALILTYNEERDLEDCIKSVEAWATKIIIADSYSQDNTLNIANTYRCEVLQHEWVSFAQQRAWIISHAPIASDWVLFIDADERLTGELREEISAKINSDPIENGFCIRRRFYFLNKWLKHGGYYPSSEIRLFRKDKVQFHDEDGGARERFLISGKVGTLRNDMLHVYQKTISNWIIKHDRLAILEAGSDLSNNNQIYYGIYGIKVWFRLKIWKKLPRGFRPFFLFLYRYIIRLGFLDGKVGLLYCFLHDFLYPMLIDIHYYEMAHNHR
jgi:glycosyltransferase involved in cell wall biosynthesis